MGGVLSTPFAPVLSGKPLCLAALLSLAITAAILLAAYLRRSARSKALAESEARFRTLSEFTTAAILLYQADRIVYANQAALEITGYSEEELLAMHFWELVKEEHREMVKQRGLERQRGEAAPPHYEFKVLRKDGTARWVDASAGTVTYKGSPAGLMTAYDITKWKEAEEQIIRRNRQLQALLSSSQAMAGFMDLSGVLRAICQAAVEAFGLRMAWVGKVIPESTELIFVVSAGFNEGYAEQIRARWDESPEGQGPTGRCMRTRRPVVAHTTDAAFSPWRERAEARGYDAVCALPLLHEGTVRGALTVYSSNSNAFDPETIEVLEIFARQCTMVLVNAGLYNEARQYIEELLRSSQ